VPASLKERTVLVIGRGSGIARAITLAIREAGGKVVVAGHAKDALAAAYDDAGITAERVDLTDESSIAALAAQLGHVDHVVSTASARARGDVADLNHDTVALSFNVKVIGPIFLAKHFAPRMRATRRQNVDSRMGQSVGQRPTIDHHRRPPALVIPEGVEPVKALWGVLIFLFGFSVRFWVRRVEASGSRIGPWADRGAMPRS
jgi:NAD(P)-dependent dehydrogenase (short-subunit alcohol dehydrogenase family)